MAIELVTGFAGKAHVKSAQDGAFNSGIFGNASYVLTSGNNISASMITNNLIRILDGDILMQGRHVCIPAGTYEELQVSNGITGMNRNDLVVLQYTKDSTTGVEKAELVIKQGTSTSGTASDPSYTTGNILSGCNIAEVPLYRIKLTGINVAAPVKLIGVVDTITALRAALNNNINNLDNNYYKKAIIDSLSTALANDINNLAYNYYTGSEVDTLLNGKAPSDHNHDGRYYTETQVNTLLNGKASSDHNHDSRYFTETEINKMVYGASNSVLTDALSVNLTNAAAEINMPHIVLNTTTTSNMPTNLCYGIRYVDFMVSSNIVVTIRGFDTYKKPVIWQNTYNNGNWQGWDEKTSLIKSGTYSFYVVKPMYPVYGQSYYEYQVPLLQADEYYTISISSVTMMGASAITSSCSIIQRSKSGVLIKDTNTNGAGYLMDIKLKITK